MTYINAVSPDFPPDHIAGWFIFNTWLQNTLGLPIRLELHDDFASHHRDIAADKIDMIYANPTDAAVLVREKGFVGVARPLCISDEAVVVVSADSSIQSIEDLSPDARVAATSQPDVRMMGMIMLEPADISAATAQMVHCNTYVLIAKALMNGNADVGFFLKEGYDNLSSMVKKGLRPLVSSEIQLVRHGLMIGPRMNEHRTKMLAALLDMSNSDKGKDVLDNLGFSGWEAFENEEVEFMIDLMDTLTA